MRIELYIERLVVDGLPVTTAQLPRFRIAIQQELTRLLALHGLRDELSGGIAVPRVRAGEIRFRKNSDAVSLGRSVARAVHEGIGTSKAEKTK